MQHLDPQAAAFLRQAQEFVGAPDAETARAAHLETAHVLAGPADAVGEVRSVQVQGAAGPLDARLVRPRDAAPGQVLPLAVFFHGGGWVVGTLETYASLQNALANASGAAVLSVDYRMAPEHRHPAAVEDAVAATRWVLDNADDLAVDPSRVGVAGDSAGGHLAAVVARHLADRVAYQVLVYPVTDATCSQPSWTENATGYYLSAQGMRWYWDQYLGNDHSDLKDPDVSPLHAPLAGPLPPAFVLTAGFDPLRDEGAAYADALEQAGTEVVRYPAAGQVHGYVRWLAKMDAAAESVRAIGAFIREHSAGRG